MGPVASSEPLVAAITRFLAHQDVRAVDEIRESLVREIDAAGPEALSALCARLAATGAGWEYYPRDPLARRLHQLIADRILAAHTTLSGIEHVHAVAGKPVVLLANHLSYSDANVLEVVLHRWGGAELADRLTVIAGPKVYSNIHRRFSSLCFATIRVPQSGAVATGDAVMPAREVARAARSSLDAAHARLRGGEALLVFAEGTRSRSCEMQRFLPAVARYLEFPDALALPIGMTGTEMLFPVGEDAFTPAPISVRVGPPIDAGCLRAAANGSRQAVMDQVAAAIATLLPPPYRGVYGDATIGGHADSL
jgi:1-acyl-sn-glycerol-3-phosphate acyltransferase